MPKVVWTDKVSRYHDHILEISRELSPEEASVILSRILTQSMHHWSSGSTKINVILEADAIRLEERISAQVMVKK